MNSVLVLDVCGVLGVIVMCLIEMITIQKANRMANIPFDWKKDYLYRDAISIILSFVLVAVWHLVFAEVVASYEGLSGYARLSFFGIGLFGTFLIFLLFGKGKAYAKQIIDVKTNIADVVTGGTTTVHETIEKGKEVTGQDVTKNPVS